MMTESSLSSRLIKSQGVLRALTILNTVFFANILEQDHESESMFEKLFVITPCEGWNQKSKQMFEGTPMRDSKHQ